MNFIFLNPDFSIGKFFSLQNCYIISCIIISLLMWIESSHIDKNDGKLPEDGFFATISLITSSWVFISAAALWFVDFSNLAMSVPVVFGVYSVMNWIYSFSVLKEAGIPDDPMEIIIPQKLCTFAKSFALVFMMLSVFMLFTQIYQIDFTALFS